MILRFLKDNATLLLLLATIGVLWLSNGRLEEQRDAALAQVTYLSGQIDRQNEAVTRWKEAAEGNREIYLAGLEAAGRKAIRLEIDAEEILALPVPPEPQQCEAARELLIGGNE